MDLTRLRPVFEHSGPYLTVHAELGRTTETAGAGQESRWTTVRHELERAHADDRLVSEVGRRLQENTHVAGPRRAPGPRRLGRGRGPRSRSCS